MKLRNTPEERMENLLAYFGWQGGTIHQVAAITGVNYQVLLDGSRPDGPSKRADRCNQGSLASTTCGLAYRLGLVKDVQGDADYWIGVGEAVPQSLRTAVLTCKPTLQVSSHGTCEPNAPCGRCEAEA